jgi:nucleoid-associated protein YgaU
MLLGLVLVIVAMLWLFAGPGISPRARVLNLRSNRQTTPPPETSGSTNSSDSDTEENNQLSATDNQSQEPERKKYWQPEKIKTQRFHIISEGETLSEISRKYYDSARKWQKILDANRDVIEDVSKLKPGTKLIIPE